MSKSFTIKKTDPQGLARLSNEIRLMWTEIEKLSTTKEVPIVSTKNVQEISILGNALSVDKFLNEQGDYTALDSVNISTVKSGADSNNTSQSTLISAASSVGGGGGSSAISYALSADTSVTTVENSKDVSQSTLIAKADSKGESAVTKSDSADVSQSTLISTASSMAGGGGTPQSYVDSVVSSVVTVADSKDIIQSTAISTTSSAASLSDTKAESGSVRASSVALSASTGISNALASDGANSSSASLADTKAESASTRASSVSLSSSTGISTATSKADYHHTRHEDGGSDEISVTGLSGLLVTDQHVLDTEVDARLPTTQYYALPDRAIGTVYQNTTGKVMYVGVTLNNTTTGSAIAICNADNPPTYLVGSISGTVGYNVYFMFIVLPNYYYKITHDTTATLVAWWEWY